MSNNENWKQEQVPWFTENEGNVDPNPWHKDEQEKAQSTATRVNEAAPQQNVERLTTKQARRRRFWKKTSVGIIATIALGMGERFMEEFFKD